jgi:hypothetical protein
MREDGYCPVPNSGWAAYPLKDKRVVYAAARRGLTHFMSPQEKDRLFAELGPGVRAEIQAEEDAAKRAAEEDAEHTAKLALIGIAVALLVWIIATVAWGWRGVLLPVFLIVVYVVGSALKGTFDVSGVIVKKKR